MAKALWDQDWSAPQGDAPVGSTSDDLWSQDWSVPPSVADPEQGDFMAGMGAGWEGLKGLWQYGKAAIGKMVDSPEMLREGLQAASEYERRAAEYGQGRVTNWDDITDFDEDPLQFAKDFADYAQFGMGTLAPHAAESALGAIAGGAIGAATTGGVGTAPGFFGGLVAKQAMKETLKAYAKHELKDVAKDKLEAQVKKDFVEYATGALKDEAKKRVIQSSIKRAGANIGAKVGAFGASTSTGLGDLYSNTVTEGNPDGSPWMALAGAPVYGALDLVPEAMGIDRLMKSGVGNRLGNFFKGLFTQVPAEASTEMLQEEMNIQLQALHDPTYDPWGEDAWVRRRESGILGGMGGGVFGGATGALQKPVSEAQSVDEAIALADQHAGMVLHGARQQKAQQESAIQAIVGAGDVSLQTMPTTQEDAYRGIVESIFNDAKQNIPIAQEERNQRIIDQTPTELTPAEMEPARQLALDSDMRRRLAINEKESPEAAQARQQAQDSWIEDLRTESAVDKKPVNKAMANALAKAGVVTEQQAADAGVKFSPEQLTERANQAATSELNDLKPPTDAQKEAGNYKVGKVTLNGLGVSIENPKGSLREGTDKDGVKWSQKLGAHYGYIRGTVGADKDHVDAFLTDNASDANAPVFVVDQVNPGTTKFDEHKVILGARSEQEAVDTYLSNYQDGWTGLGSITQMDQATFKEWVKDPKNTSRRLNLRPYKGANDVGEDTNLYVGEPTPGKTVQGTESTVDSPESTGVQGGETRVEDTFLTNYKHVPTKTVKVGVDKVTNPEEAAHVLSSIRKGGQEVFYALVLGKDGEILDVQNLTKGDRSGASVPPNVVGPSIASVEGAAQVYYGHNHPTGDPNPSTADVAITKALDEFLDGTGIVPKGHVVIGRDGAAHFIGSDLSQTPVKIKPRLRKRTVSVTERQVRKLPPVDRTPITSESVGREVLKDLPMDSLALLDNKHQLVGSVNLTAREMDSLRDGVQVKRILTAIDKTNASAGFIKSTNVEAAKNLTRFINEGSKLRLLDALVGGKSAGIAEEHGMWFSPQQKSDKVVDTSAVSFEVAPDPNNIELKGRWGKLSDDKRLEGSRKVAEEIVPKVLKHLGIKGGISDQIGGYLDDTNPSFALKFEGKVTEAQVEEATRLLGYVLSQDAMMTTSEVELPGSEEVGTVSIKLPKGLSIDEVRKIYNSLRKLRVKGEQVIGGHSTRDGVMDILNYSNVPTKELVGLVRNKLLGKYPVTSKTLYAIFPEKADYGFDNDKAANALRGEATDKLKGLLDEEGAAFSPRSVALRDEIPGLKALYPYLTKAERDNLTRRSAATLVEVFESMPNPAEMASVAYAGRAKRGWYKNSARALVEVFGAVDAPRFAGLLAAMSPQTSVENNAINALNTWANWIAEGRPTEREAIIQVMGRSVQGNKGVDSVLDAWINNSVRALTATDPTEIMLSGPKVNSFMLNLRDEVNEVTNDAWMAYYSGVDQILFSGSATKSGPGKRPGYLAMSATVRNAAKIVSKRTGEKWTPAEVQETVWSWTKALYELRNSRTNKATVAEILAAGDLTHDMINDTPDFELVFIGGVYRNILEGAGYGKEIAEVERVVKSRLENNQGDWRRAPVTDAEGAGVTQDTFERHLGRAGERLETLRTTRRGGVNLSTRQEVLSDGKPVTEGGRVTEATRALGRRLGLGEDAYVEVGVRDATTRTFVETFVERILGKRAVFFKSVDAKNPKFNGVVLRETPDIIYLDAEGDRAHLVTLGHELLHVMRLDNPTLYEDLRAALMPMLKDYEPYRKFTNRPRNELGLGDMSEDKVIEELIGDLMGDGFADPEFWAKVNQKSPALLVRVASALKAFLDSVLDVLVGNQLMGTKYYKDYKKARDFAALAMAEYADKRVKSLDLVRVTEDVVVEETGERITLEIPASVMLEQSNNRINALRQLQRCLSL